MSTAEQETNMAGDTPPEVDAEKSKSSKSLHAGSDANVRSRAVRWAWNGKLIGISLAIAVVLIGVATASYFYHSATAAGTFLQRAEAADEEGDLAAQAKWLQRYSLLKPDDLDAVVKIAIATDTAADTAAPENRGAAIDAARKQLSRAVARLGDNDAETSRDLRERLIDRLLQLGGPWLREAEQQVVIKLQAEPGDPQATKWLAQSLIGQVNTDRYIERRADEHTEEAGHWLWLSEQSVGVVLARAVELNPSDLDLIASFLSAYRTRPELFEVANDASDSGASPDYQSLVEQTLTTLQQNADGRSKLIYFGYKLDENPSDELISELMDEAEAASERLADAAEALSSETKETPQQFDGLQLPAYYWDYLMVTEAAARVSEKSPLLAESWYDQLLGLSLPAIPKALAENVFLTAGRRQQFAGNQDRAIEIWERGVQQVNPDSVDLLGAIAASRMLLVTSSTEPDVPKVADDSQKAVAAMKAFHDAIETASTRITRASTSQMSATNRIASSRGIEAARWQLNVLEVYQAIRDDRRVEAINRLTTALSADVDVDDRLRISVGQQLAALHRADGSWDQAAATLDRTLQYAPGDESLRAQAAEAWNRSGNRDRAMQLWQTSANSNSLAIRLASVEAMFNEQLRLLPEQRDLSGVRAAIRRIRGTIPDPAALTADQQAAANQAAGMLDIFEISLPPIGQSAGDYIDSPEMADRIVELATKYPEDSRVQAFAAERLAACGEEDALSDAVERLEAIVGSDTYAMAATQARIEAARGEPIAAARLLLDQALRDPNRAAGLLRMASNYATNGGDGDLAYEALLKIPDDQKTVSTVFQLAMLARGLADESAHTSNGERSPDKLSLQWEQQLRNREGDKGTFWRFLKATRIIDEMRNDANQVEPNDPRLRDATKLVREILSWRPRWGQAISLQGYLSAIERRPERAVEQLRLGIAAGDGRFQTRSLLVRQLDLLKRFDEAEREIRVATIATAAEIDPYSEAMINIALKQGDYDRSLEFAEATVKNRPDDYVSYVLLCRTAIVAAGVAESTEAREQLLAKAQQAITKAGELAGQDQPQVFSARLQLALAKDSEQAVRDEITRIEESGLSAFDKLVLQSQAHIGVGELEVAEDLLQRAYKLRPSLQIQLRLAELYRGLRQSDGEIAVLREAHRQYPENAQLRNQLARALAARDAEDVDWKELAELLSGQGVHSSNRFVFAALLLGKGDERQKDQALTMLREIKAEENNYSDPAARLLAGALRRKIRELPEDQQTQRDQLASEVRSIYEALLERQPQLPADLYHYASFLLDQPTEDDLPQVAPILSQLKSMPSASLYTLEVAVRYELKANGPEDTPRVVQSWTEDVMGSGELDGAKVAEVAGLALQQLGFAEQGLDWIRKAYEQEPRMLGRYFVALTQLGRIDECIEVCAEHFRTHGDELSASLLVESLTLDIDKSTRREYEQLVDETLKRHPNHIPLLEGVATLRLQQRRSDEAIAMYRQVREVDPLRLRTLNNLAVLLSEVPGRAAEGIELINQAIEIAGELPELLDSKGMVLLKAGRLDEAEAVFRQAMLDSDEPRFRFHLIVTLINQNATAEAKKEWKSLDLEKLDPSGLTPAEQQQLETMKKDFGTK